MFFHQSFLLSQAQLAVEHHKEADQLGKHTVNDGDNQEHEIHAQESTGQRQQRGFQAVVVDFPQGDQQIRRRAHKADRLNDIVKRCFFQGEEVGKHHQHHLGNNVRQQGVSGIGRDLAELAPSVCQRGNSPVAQHEQRVEAHGLGQDHEDVQILIGCGVKVEGG